MSNEAPQVKDLPNTVVELPLSRLVPPWTMLRTVRKNSIEWLELVDSIRNHGVLNSILVRPHPHQEGKYEIIDGMWRFSAARELDFSDLPCILVMRDLSDEAFMSLQIQANSVSYETKPIEFAEQMQRLLQLREEMDSPMTLTELAQTVGKSTSWVSQRLRLLSLCDEVKDAIREGTLNLGKAVALTRIRSERHQKRFLAVARTAKTTRAFELEVGTFIASMRDGKAAQRREYRDEITLKPRIQSMDTMLIELDRMENLSQIIVQNNLTTALDGAKLALEWVLNLHEDGRKRQVREMRHLLTDRQRLELIGRQRYEELRELRDLKEEQDLRERVPFHEGDPGE